MNIAKGKDKRRLRLRAIHRVRRHFAPHMRPYRGKLWAAVVCMSGATVMELLRPWPLKFIFDAILASPEKAMKRYGWLIERVGSADALLAITVVAILVIAILAGLFRYGEAYSAATVGQRVVAGVRYDLFRHIQRLSHSFHDSSNSGDLLARLTGDIRAMRDLMVGAVIYLADRSFMIIGMLAVMAWMDWRLTSVALIVVPLLAITVTRFGSEIKGATRRVRRKESMITNVMTEKISSIKVVQAFAREAYEAEIFSKRNNSSVKASLQGTKLEGRMDRLVDIILALGTAGVAWIGVLRVRHGAMTPGDLLVFTSYLRSLYKPIGRLADLTSRIAKATVSGERIVSILEIEPDITDAPDAVPAPPLRAEIEFDDVHFEYKPGAPVLRGVSFRARPGEIVALVGESGSGKSTIADLLLRFYDPTAGRILIDGHELPHYTLTSLREQVGIVLQESVLFDATIRENITYGELDATPEDVVAAAKAANAHDFIEALPEGYDTMVGERGANLSGGQRQRIAITRAIIRNAPILILDEPMSGLDIENEARVQEALRRLMAGRTTLLITHDLEAAAEADKILLLRDGRITEIDKQALAGETNREGLASVLASRPEAIAAGEA